MPKFRIHQVDGAITRVDGLSFIFDVQDVPFAFFVHAANSPDAVLAVSHLESGLRVAVVPAYVLRACNSDEVAAAKIALQKMTEQHGGARMRSILAGARSL